MERTMEERVARLEKQVARLLKGKRPRDDGALIWQRLEDRHLKAWERNGGTDHTDITKHLDRSFVVSADEMDDLVFYLSDRGNIPFNVNQAEIVVAVDRGTIRATVK